MYLKGAKWSQGVPGRLTVRGGIFGGMWLKEKHHAAVTDPQRIGELLRTIGFTGQFMTLKALQLAPLVFVRPGELRRAEWSEFDLEARIWRIPAERMKMKAAHLIPLSAQAVTVLQELSAFSGHGRYVFPGLRTATRPMSENTGNAALRRLGYSGEEMTGHGFRSMAATRLNEMGWRIDAIERQLAHAETNKVREAYMQARYYDPAVGRFLSADPMTPTSGELFRFSRYDYANNNPTTNIDPDGRDNCPGQSRSSCIRSDSESARNLESTKQQDSAAVENKSMVETSEKPERAVALIGTTDVTVLPVIGEVIQTTGKDGINLKNLPPGTSAVEHSHIDGKTVGVSSEGFVSPGDAQPLGHGVINYAVSERRVAKYEIVGGRIQVTAIEGRFTSPESTKLEQSINAQQPAIDAVRPSE